MTILSAPGSQTMKSPICRELRGEVGGGPAVFGQAAKISHNVAPLCQLGPGALQEGGGGPGELGLLPTATGPGHLLALAGPGPLRASSSAPCVS